MTIVRIVVGGIGIAMLLAGVVVLGLGGPFLVVIWLTILGLTVSLGTIFERVYYKRLATRTPGTGWIATEERFVDPTTGRLVEVHVKPTTGERLYVDIGTPPEDKPR
jgi:hypothetical protein